MHIDQVIMDLELHFLIKLDPKASYTTMGDLVKAVSEEARRESHHTTRAEVVAFVRKTLVKRYELGFFKRWRLNEETRISNLL